MRAVFDSKDFDKFMRSNAKFQLYRLVRSFTVITNLPDGFRYLKSQTIKDLLFLLPQESWYIDDSIEVISYQFINPKNIVIVFKNKTILLMQEDDTRIILSSMLDDKTKVIQTRVIYKNYIVGNEYTYRSFRKHRYRLFEQITSTFEMQL